MKIFLLQLVDPIRRAQLWPDGGLLQLRECMQGQRPRLPVLKVGALAALMMTGCGDVQKIETSGSVLRLAEDGLTEYRIVVSTPDDPCVSNAASRLAAYLKKITGATFPVVGAGADEATGPRILLGMGEPVAGLIPEGQIPELGVDGFLIRSVGSDLVILGSSPRGTLYGVFDFLERVLGCEWWTPEVSHVPEVANLEIPPQDHHLTPVLPYRDPYFEAVAGDHAFAAKMRRSGKTHDPGLPAEWGGSMEIIGFCHTFDVFLPAAEYFEQHPEWGGMRGGERQAWGQHTGQPCLTNEGFLAAFTEKVLERIEASESREMISVSQNDNLYPCECPDCLSVETEEGAASGPIIRFVNAVAREVAKKYPETLVETLAYTYSTAPPQRTRPEPNVIIRLATYLDNHAVPFEHAGNAAFQERLQGWSDISKQLFIWDYTADFEDQWKLRPNLFHFAPNIRYFVRHGARGVLSQGGEKWQQRTDFVGLRAWLVSQLLWDPEQDDTALIRRYLDGYYGPAAKSLEEYLQLVHHAAQNTDILMVGGGVAQLPFPADFFPEADRLFGQAERAVADNPELLRRVQIERLAVDYFCILRYAELRDAHGVHLFPDAQSAIDACDELLRHATALGVATPQGYLADEPCPASGAATP